MRPKRREETNPNVVEGPFPPNEPAPEALDELNLRRERIVYDGITNLPIHPFETPERVDEPWAVHTDPTRSEDPIQRAKMREWQLPHVVARDTAGYNPDLQDWGPIVVPRDSFFMMGDNRDSSYDGRYWGFLPRQNVRGRPLVVYFSYDANSWKSLPFFTAVRWQRIFSAPE